MAMVELPLSGLADVIAEGLHTGLRKGTDAEDSHDLWKAISDSQTSAWSDAAKFCAYGMRSMGLTVIDGGNPLALLAECREWMKQVEQLGYTNIDPTLRTAIDEALGTA